MGGGVGMLFHLIYLQWRHGGLKPAWEVDRGGCHLHFCLCAYLEPTCHVEGGRPGTAFSTGRHHAHVPLSVATTKPCSGLCLGGMRGGGGGGGGGGRARRLYTATTHIAWHCLPLTLLCRGGLTHILAGACMPACRHLLGTVTLRRGLTHSAPFSHTTSLTRKGSLTGPCPLCLCPKAWQTHALSPSLCFTSPGLLSGLTCCSDSRRNIASPLSVPQLNSHIHLLWLGGGPLMGSPSPSSPNSMSL